MTDLTQQSCKPCEGGIPGLNREQAETLMKKLTGWEPLYADRDGFKRGLIETVKWFAKLENLKKYKTDVYNI